MGHRHMFCISQLPDMENNQNWNHPHPDPRLHLENGPLILPAENTAVSGANTMACFNMSNFGSEVPNYRVANTGIPHAPHDPYLHASSAGSSSRVPPDYFQHGPSFYNQYTIGAMSSTVNPQMDYVRAPFKRKIPTLSATFDSGSSSSYHGAGSSSSLHVPSDHLHPKPVLGPQCWPMDHTSMGPSYGSNNVLIGGEGSQRNVRSRHSHALHLDINMTGSHPSSNLPHHIPTINISGPPVAGQWSHPPLSLDTRNIGGFSRETNRSLAGSNVGNTSMEIDGGYHSNHISSRHPTIPLPTPHVPSMRGMGIGRSSHGQRTTYRAMPGYRSTGFAPTLEDGRRPGVEAGAPLRHARPLSVIGRSSERLGRPRNIYDRFHPISDDDNARNRWVSEGVAIMDHTAFFDSRSYIDQHRDMRLDIDNMSYEELLALEERIGNVNTGLSDDKISKCLTEITYCSDQVQAEQEEVNCAICLEEYKDRESLGRLKCRHDFHLSCIKEWLLVKNVCPICKASAVEDAMKEK